MTDYAADLDLALELADIADAITGRRFRASNLTVDAKPDLTPVSDADIACEKALRTHLEQHRSTDEVLGEEFGGELHTSGRQWVIDPIDGTKNYVRGVPVWATLIALLVDGEPVVGVVSAPALGKRWHAAEGQGTWRMDTATGDGQAHQVSASKVASLDDAFLSYSSLHGWAERGLAEEMNNLLASTWYSRGYGDFLSYCLLAEGSVDIAVEPEVSLWDLAAVSVLVTEAGGAFTSLKGQPGPTHGEAVATNGWLHNKVLGIFSPGTA